MSRSIIIAFLIFLILSVVLGYRKQSYGQRAIPPRTSVIQINTPCSTTNLLWVSPNGSDSNPGTQVAPLKTFAHTSQIIKAGQTAIFEDGTYNETGVVRVFAAGTAANPVCFESQHPLGATLSYTLTGGSETSIMLYAPYQYFLYFNLTIASAARTDYDYAIEAWWGCNHCRIAGNKFTLSPSIQLPFGMKPNADFVTIDHNYIENGIDAVGPQGLMIYDNDIHMVHPFANGDGDIGVLLKGGTRNTQVFNNYIHASQSVKSATGIVLGGDTDPQYAYTRTGYEDYNSVAYNNIIVPDSQGITSLDQGLVVASCSYCTFSNNVVIDANTAFDASGGGVGSTNNNPTWINNIVVNANTGFSGSSSVTGTATIDYNLFDNVSNPPSQAHGVTGNPLFVNNYNAWNLQNSSPATGKALTVSPLATYSDAPAGTTCSGQDTAPCTAPTPPISIASANTCALLNGAWTCPDSIFQRITPWDIGAYDHRSANTTPGPTNPISQGPTPTNTPGGTPFSITVCPHGLGNCGDNVNPNGGGNTSPQHTTRSVTLSILSNSGQQIAQGSGTVSYNTSSENFQGTISVPNLSSGQYLVSVKMDGFLSKQIPGIISVIQGQSVTLPSVPLTAGDINNDNQLDLLDYNILISCFGSKMTTSSCTNPPTSSSPGSDINDDGMVDGVDYNLFIRELSVQRGGSGGPTPTSVLNPTDTPTTSPNNTLTPTPGPSGTKQTITSYGWGGSAAFQPAGSPWWTLNNAWGGPPPNTQAIDYYPNNFPNYTTIRWSYSGSGGNVLGYPEIIIGDQNGQTIKSPNGVEPAWYGKTLGSLSHLILSWDIVINAQNGNNWDILFENHMMGHETGIFLKDPWVRSGNSFSNLGGISGIGLPNCWATGSFCVVPSTVLAGTPMLKGSIDLLPIFKWAISNGWMSSNESVYGWEFGVESTNGSGSVTFNSLSVDIQ